jgi:hypothetical protein
MASSVEETKLGTRMMPYLAILQHDLGALWASRLVRLWLVATVVLTVVLAGSNWANFQDGTLIASLLFPYLVFPWFFVIVVLGVSPVSGSRAEALADGILSRSVGRWGYLLATWSARVALLWGVYLVVTVPMILLVTLAKRPVPEDTVTIYGVVSSLFLVGLVQTFLVSLGFLMGTLLRRPLLAVVVLVFLWYPVGLILSVFSLEEFSPVSLSRAISTQLRRPLLAREAEDEGTGDAQEMQSFTEQMDRWVNIFSPSGPAPEASRPEFFEGEKFEDLSVVRVALGYGVPSVVAVFLAGVCFYRRDL